MNTSFYAASRAARTQQSRLDVIANNMANVNTVGYKSQSTVFQDLLYYNMRASEEEVTKLNAGTGVKVSHTNTDFSAGGLMATSDNLSYAILGDGFFAVQNPATSEISYTRNGQFYLSERADGYYLSTDNQKLVLDQNGQAIKAVDGEINANFGIYTFANTDGMLLKGNSEFQPIEKNGAPILLAGATVLSNQVELSNVDLAKEMAGTIETSRAYSYALKMVQTSDEVEQTINNLRS